jgi:hypothetical protein
MDSKFQHEQHNRQDKARKPDYREELREKPPTYNHWPDPERLQARNEARKDAMRWEAMRRVRRRRFFLGGHQFRIGWPLDHFAKTYGLAVGEPRTKLAYDKIRSAAESDMERISEAILKGSVRRLQMYVRDWCVNGAGRVSLAGYTVEWSVQNITCDEIR